jgi:TolA-binding protein
MKNPSPAKDLAENLRIRQFRVDFDANAALISAPRHNATTLMSKEITESTGPLGEISQGPGAFEQFLDRNQKGIAVLAILLALGAAGLVVQRGISRSHERNAGAAFNRAIDIPSLQEIIREHPKTAAGGSAVVMLADSQWKDGQQDAAVTTLRDFLDNNGNHPARHTARASLGSKLMAQGKSEDAAREFRELADDPSAAFIAPYALIALGDIAKAGGKLDEAEGLYQRVRNGFPDSPFADGASRRLTLLKAVPPAEIDPPAPESADESITEPTSETSPEAGETTPEETPQESAPADEAPESSPEESPDSTLSGTPEN